MADQGTGSQGHSRKRRLTPDENDVSPPTPDISSQESTAKPKQLPTVTPRRFKRFFTPRSSLGKSPTTGSSRRVLRDITAGGLNSRNLRRTRKASREVEVLEEDDTEAVPCVSRKRKQVPIVTPATTPDNSSPSRESRGTSLGICQDEEDTDTDNDSEASMASSLESDLEDDQRPTRPIVRWKQHCFPGQALLRECQGLFKTRGKSYLSYGTEWQHETTNFSSTQDDWYTCRNVAPTEAEYAIPFCTLGCNTNSLVAIGDEEGSVRLLDSNEDVEIGFTREYLSFRPHTNAVLDLAFSPDDLLLATASGDQTSQVIDMQTQTAIFKMAGHNWSVKQVCFQPGSSSVIATSSRDGSVLIWDLRCKGYDGPAQDLKAMLAPAESDGSTRPDGLKLSFARPINTIDEAHLEVPYHEVPGIGRSGVKTAQNRDARSRIEKQSRHGDVSVTALSFLGSGREHLLLTGSEANAIVKLWDIRTKHNNRRGRAMPLSSTQAPESHDSHREFGLTSMSLSGDGGRLYTVCRDNTIYAYSTAHLIFGYAPELSLSNSRPRRKGGSNKQGLGPIYGFRHPKFHASTFYIKSALRSATQEHSELLAVGSSDGCAVLFPTDERYLEPSDSPEVHEVEVPGTPELRPPHTILWKKPPRTSFARLHDTIPIYHQGTALLRGHRREVTGVSWTSRGELVTVGDDLSARCWREGSEARDLRVGGETEGRRWGRGWAEAEGDWDDEE